MIKKKLLSVLLSTAIVATMLGGCGSKSDDSDSSNSDSADIVEDTSSDNADTDTDSSDETVTLTYWGWDSNYYKPMFDAYTALYPNVKFEPTAVEWGDMLTKAQQALASGSELPTMIAMDFTLIENWKDMNICEDLTQYGLDKSKYVESLIDKSTTDDGKVIGVLENVCPSGIAYKRDLAKEYFGTDDPDEISSMFATYDDYIKKGAEVYEKSNGKVHLFHSGQAVAEWLYFASEIANQDGNNINFSSKMTDVFTKLIALRDANAVDTYQNGTPEANATYTDDAHIFYPCPDWAITYYIETNDPEGSGNWGIIKAPVSYSHGGTCLGITSASTDAQKKAAYDFIMWATSSEEGVKTARDEAGYVPAYKDFTYDEEFTKRSDEDFFGGQNISSLYYKEIVSEMAIAPSSAWDNSIVSVRNDVAQQLMDDKNMTLDDALSIGKDELSQLITDSDITIQ